MLSELQEEIPGRIVFLVKAAPELTLGSVNPANNFGGPGVARSICRAETQRIRMGSQLKVKPGRPGIT